MSRDISPLSYSPLKPMLYSNNGNGYPDTFVSRENDHYFKFEGMNHRRRRNSLDSSLNSGSIVTRSEMLPFRDRSTESAVLAPYDYHPERTYSNGGTHLVSERHTYQHSRFNRHPDYREILSHPTMEQESKYGFRNQSMGSNYSNNLPSHENQRDWSSWRNESASQITPSSSYDDSRRRSSNVNYNLSYPERPPTYDNQRKFWQPESSRASSPIWRSRTQKWPPRAPVISNSSILRPRPFPEPLVRHKIEPSYMWKRPMQEDHERKTSRTIIHSPERPRISVDNYTPDYRPRNNAQVPIPTHSLPDESNRRFQQIPIPQPQPQPHPPFRFEPRDRYRDFYRSSDNSRRPPPYNPKHRPLHRISARISARPRRSPSPSESSSETSRSHSYHRSPSRSRSSDRSSPRHDGSQARHSLSDFRLNGISRSSHNHSNIHISYRGEISSEPLNSSRLNLISDLNGSREAVQGRRRSSSASSYHSEGSINSSVNVVDSDSEPRLDKVIPELSGHGPTITASRKSSPVGFTIRPVLQEPFFPIHSQTPLSFPSIEDNLELPGMKFNTKGVPRADENAIVHKANVVGNKETEGVKFNVTNEKPLKLPLAVNEADPSRNNDIDRQLDRRVYREGPSLSPSSPDLPGISVPLDNELIEDEQTDIGPNGKVNMPSPSDATMSMAESEASLSNSPKIIDKTDQEVTVLLPNQVQEYSPLTDFAPLSSSPVINITEEALDNKVVISTVNDVDPSTQPRKDFASALHFVASGINSSTLPLETRYDYVFEANLALQDAPVLRRQTTDEELVQEVMDGPFRLRSDNYPNIAQTLIERFKKRSADFAAKTRCLQSEYKALHLRWAANCRKLDQNLASQTVEPPSPTFRAPRRSNGFGDIVRSDLEMEQIIASLGNEDMTDPNVLAIRNMATIPDLISTDVDSHDISYLDDNGLIENPVQFFDTYSALGRWTEEEKELFLEKYGTYPKQFDVIASFLPGKTATQCIMFYYLHKKELLNFRAAVKKHGPKRKRGRKGGKGKGKGNALLADIMKPSRGQDGEDTGHRQMQQFGGMAAINGRKILSRRFIMQTGLSNEGNAGSFNVGNLSSGADITRNDGNPRLSKSRSESPEEVDDSAIVVDHRRKRSDKPMGSIVESDDVVVLSEKPKEKVKRPPGRPPKQPKQPVRGDETGPSVVPVKVTSYVWTKYEEAQYLKLVKEHGRDFRKIADGMPAKTELQCRNYFRKHRELERIAKEAEERLAKHSRS